MFFFFKQKTAYEMRISDWSSDVCSSDLGRGSSWTAPADGARTGRADMRAATMPMTILAALAVLALAACHTLGHVPPGQAKKVLAPPPGHSGDKPGRGN